MQLEIKITAKCKVTDNQLDPTLTKFQLILSTIRMIIVDIKLNLL